MQGTYEKNKKFWEKAVSQGNLIYPSEQVIPFIKKNENSCMRVLDFGCGAGRNAIAIAREGCEVVAMDYNENLLDIVRRKIDKEGLLNIQCVRNEGTSVPGEKDRFDRIVANGALFYESVDTVSMILQNLRHVLKPGGLFWADYRTKQDSLYQMGTKLDEYSVKMNQASGREGSVYVFMDRGLLGELYTDAGLKILSLDTMRYTENNGEKTNEWYHVVATK